MGTPLQLRRAAAVAAAAFLLGAPACSRLPRSGGGLEPVGGAPAAFLRLASEAQTARTIAVREGLTRAAAWRLLTDYVSQRHMIAVRDQSAGFVMTAWEASLAREGVPDLRYRTRLVVNFVGEDWRFLQVRAEANWKEGDEWQVGVDREQLERAATELQARFGPR